MASLIIVLPLAFLCGFLCGFIFEGCAEPSLISEAKDDIKETAGEVKN